MAISSRTAVDMIQFLREVCASVMIKYGNPIGGVGKVVEIDESKFGRRKYNRVSIFVSLIIGMRIKRFFASCIRYFLLSLYIYH